MAGYIGARSQVVSSTSIANAQDITATDTTPEVTIINNTHEDTDGGREGKVIFKGQQSGGEESTLAEIQGSHDGTSDDEKGDLIFKTNDGSDGTSPTERLKIDSSGVVNVGTASGTQPSYFNSFLNVQNNASTSNHASITITSGTGGYAGLHFGDSANGRIGQVAYTNTDDALLFTANNSERMRIDSAGNVGIGTVAPLRPFHVSGAGDTSLMLQTTNAVDDKEIWEVQAAGNSSNHADLIFRTRVNAGTGGSESIRFRQDGGLCFNGDSAAANALDDYETGSFQMTLTGINTNNAVGYGIYVKVGNLCHFSFYSGTVTVTSSVAPVLGGLPFTSISPFGSGSAYPTVSFSHNTWTANASTGYINIGSTNIYPTNLNSSGATATATGSKYVMCSGTYYVA